MVLKGGDIRDKELNESIHLTREDIRSPISPEIRVTPFRLTEADYLKLTSTSKLSVVSNAVLVAFIGFIIFLIRSWIDSNKLSLNNNDIIIIIILSIGYLLLRFIDYCLNKDKRDTQKWIKNHFKEDSKRIEEQRRIYERQD